MPLAKLGYVVLDCPDPLALATFYAAVIGGTPKRDDDDWAHLEGQDGTPLAFQAAPGHVPPQWPAATHSQQFHLDLDVPQAEMDAVEKEVLALGATVLDAEDRERSFRVYADPAGHPFCLCAC
ncbi:VOC family protein [Streptomyces durmitorensis]|uniref:VOC family protein n=1 Tax=Streptomyces durmitorensis TaxID=319947 RepID=A0ABY4PWB2_9ACTN|nr:VOC family protein [Streptomyces durmitorensis]UQT58155.1 VOC family protein [Streptomyces durmitorensis]